MNTDGVNVQLQVDYMQTLSQFGGGGAIQQKVATVYEPTLLGSWIPEDFEVDENDIKCGDERLIKLPPRDQVFSTVCFRCELESSTAVPVEDVIERVQLGKDITILSESVPKLHNRLVLKEYISHVHTGKGTVFLQVPLLWVPRWLDTHWHKDLYIQVRFNKDYKDKVAITRFTAIFSTVRFPESISAQLVLLRNEPDVFVGMQNFEEDLSKVYSGVVVTNGQCNVPLPFKGDSIGLVFVT